MVISAELFPCVFDYFEMYFALASLNHKQNHSIWRIVSCDFVLVLLAVHEMEGTSI